MRTLFLLAGALLAASAVAQSPLNALTGGTNLGNTGGGLYFNLQVNSTITFTQFDVRCGNAVGQGTGPAVLDIYLGPTTYVGNVANPALWAIVGTATGNVGPNLVANFAITTPFALAPGNYGVALKSQATATAPNVNWGFGYTNGASCTSTSIPGSCGNSLFSTAELTLRAGAAQNAFLSGGIFSPRIFNGAIHYTPGGQPVAVASWESYGVGCNRSRTSFYELFPNPASLDVANTTIELALGSNSYVVSHPTAPFTAPTPTAPVAAFADGNASVLASTVFGGPLPVAILYPVGGTIQLASDLEINADGFISPVSNVWSAPTVTAFRTGNARWCPHWKNMNPTTGGNVTVEVEAATGALVVSWNAVVDNGATTNNSFQVAYLPTGAVQYRYAAMSVNGGGGQPVIIGWSHGGGVLDNEVDVSVANFTTGAVDNAELSQIMSNRPRLGTTPAFVASNLPAGTPFGVSMLDFVQINPGLNLVGFGAPDCFQYTGATVAQLVFPSGNTLTQAFPIPNAASFNGVLVFAQMASFSAGQNPLGVIFSNGTRMFMGSL